MSETDPRLFLFGALSMASLVAALFFFRFWWLSRDRLFVFLSASFCLLGLNWLVLGVVHWVPETRHHAYILRLLAFSLIIAGVVEKNLRTRRSKNENGAKKS